MKRSIIFISLALSSSFAFAQSQDMNMDMGNYQQNQMMPPPRQIQVRAPSLDIDSQWPDSSTMDDMQDMQGSRTLPSPNPGFPGFNDSTGQNQQLDNQGEDKRPPTVDFDSIKRQWENDPSQRIRQAGINLGHGPSHGIFHSPRHEDRILLKRWHHELRKIGVPDDKIIFEAQRLNKEDFTRWASRFVWWHEVNQ